MILIGTLKPLIIGVTIQVYSQKTFTPDFRI